MNKDYFDHGIPDNLYNRHAWIVGSPEIGELVWIGAFCLLDAKYASLKIGKGTDISSGTKILTHSTLKRAISEKRFLDIESAAVEIGDFCFIGTNAVILMGAQIGHHSVVAAGAVVSQGMKVPPYSLVAGIPAKIIGSSRKYLQDVASESISVVIPAYNEEETIEKVVKDAKSNLEKITQNYEIVVVNDGSTDKTKKIINNLALKDKKIRTIHHQQNRGFTGAMKTCFKSAVKNLIFLAPGDGQFEFKQLPQFLEAIRGYHVALGYKVESEEDLIRKINSKLFHLLCKSLLGINFRGISSVSLWRRFVIQSIDIKSEDSSAMFMPELIHQALQKKYKFIEVPVHWYLRKGGQPKGAGLKNMIKTLKGMFGLWIKVSL